MGVRHVALLCILIGAALYCSVTADDETAPDNCCFTFYPMPNDILRFIGRLKSYYWTDARCPKKGIIVVTKMHKKMCMDPTLPWVKKIMKALDNPRFQ